MADEHDREMEDIGLRVEGDTVVHETEEGEILRVDVSPLRIQAVQGHLAEAMEKSVLPLEPLYIEALIALANVFCETANIWLAECDELRVFEANRSSIFDVLIRMSDHVGTIPFSGLAQVPPASEKVN